MARLRIHGLFTVLACLIPINAAAQDAVEAFYRGKSLTITVGSAAGGGFEAYALLVSRHLGRHLPGHPNVVVQNIPGAGSNRAASYVALQAPKDGTAIGATQPTALMWPLISDQPVPHDPSKLIVIGSINRSVFLCLARSDAPITTFKKAFETELVSNHESTCW